MSVPFKGKTSVDICDSVRGGSNGDQSGARLRGPASVVYIVVDDIGVSALAGNGRPIGLDRGAVAMMARE
jgi:hypothetical protein